VAGEARIFLLRENVEDFSSYLLHFSREALITSCTLGRHPKEEQKKEEIKGNLDKVLHGPNLPAQP
jgi:hypothetical protein